MAGPSKKCPKCEEGAPAFMATYGDMVTLLLTFFVMMFTTATVDGYQLKLILAAFEGLGTMGGGNTLEEGKLIELGNTVGTLPSMSAGRGLADARRAAISIFQPEIRSRRVRVQEDERGLVISLASDAFFEPASAELNLEETRDVIQKLAQLLNRSDLASRYFRVEGHTDATPTDPTGRWPTNWDLSIARSLSVFQAILEYGRADDSFQERFQLMGRGEFSPVADNDTPEGRMFNRRVDVIILSEGAL